MRDEGGACTFLPMDLWLMIRIFLVVLAWGGLLLLAGYALEMLSGKFSRDPRAGGSVGAADTSDKPVSS